MHFYRPIVPALSVLHSSRSPGQLCHVPKGYRGAQSTLPRPLGLGAHSRLCYVLNVRVRVWYRFWFHFGIKHIISIDLNKLKLPIAGVVQLGQMERALDYSDGGTGFEPCSGAFFDYIIEDKVFQKF